MYTLFNLFFFLIFFDNINFLSTMLFTCTFVDIFAALSLPQRNRYFICYIWNNISYALPECVLPEFKVGRLFIFH